MNNCFLIHFNDIFEDLTIFGYNLILTVFNMFRDVHHIMMTSTNGNIFRVTGPLRGNPPVDSPDKDHSRGALLFSLIYAWTNGWRNTGDGDDLICHRAHYDVTAMIECDIILTKHLSLAAPLQYVEHDESFVIGCIWSYQNDNFRYSSDKNFVKMPTFPRLKVFKKGYIWCWWYVCFRKWISLPWVIIDSLLV